MPGEPDSTGITWRKPLPPTAVSTLGGSPVRRTAAAAWPSSVAIDSPYRPDRLRASPDAAEWSAGVVSTVRLVAMSMASASIPASTAACASAAGSQRESPGGLGTWPPGLVATNAYTGSSVTMGALARGW